MNELPEIDSEIHRAETLPGSFYHDEGLFEQGREAIFLKSWQWLGDAREVRVPGQVMPAVLLEGCLDEPLLLVRDRDDELRCLSNVCTHRGHPVVERGGVESHLRCRYHGRRFDLQGRCQSMPEFEGVEGFPCAADDLPRVDFDRIGPLLFASLAPESPFEQWIGPVRERLGWFPWDDLVHDSSRSRDYLVQTHWALYCENYLEGFHIPFVHAGLAKALDFGTYRTELWPHGSLQIAEAGSDQDAFEPPPTSRDHGRRIAAYYYWLFPNTMLNVYPWGVSVNVVRPLAVGRTKVSFLTFVADPSRLDQGAGSDLDRVEREDEVVVENVQRAIGSRLYGRGRYSPTQERGVHHFHRLLVAALHQS